jgi:hypothetical protein
MRNNKVLAMVQIFILVVILNGLLSSILIAQEDTSRFQLSKEEKRKIELEEKYRYDIQSTLKEGAENKIKSFLNSPFGLWLMSLIFLSSAPFIWNLWKQNKEKKRLKVEKVEHLLLEIDYRLSNFESKVNVLKRNYRKMNQWVFPFWILSKAGYLFPEFSERLLETLLIDANFNTNKQFQKEFNILIENINDLIKIGETLGEIQMELNRSNENVKNKFILEEFFDKNNVDSIMVNCSKAWGIIRTAPNKWL